LSDLSDCGVGVAGAADRQHRRAIGRYQFGEGTFRRASDNGEDAPISDLPSLATD
jgi:hypothetical protein